MNKELYKNVNQKLIGGGGKQKKIKKIKKKYR